MKNIITLLLVASLVSLNFDCIATSKILYCRNSSVVAQINEAQSRRDWLRARDLVSDQGCAESKNEPLCFFFHDEDSDDSQCKYPVIINSWEQYLNAANIRN